MFIKRYTSSVKKGNKRKRREKERRNSALISDYLMLFSYAYFLVDNYNDQIERQTDYLIRQLKEWILIELHPVNIQIFLKQ